MMQADFGLFYLRNLKRRDLGPESGLWETLSNMTKAPKLSTFRQWIIWRRLKKEQSFIWVAVWKESGQIVGYIKLLSDQKPARGGALAGHTEDVVVREGFENNGVATVLINTLISFAKKMKMYRLTLFCDPKFQEFYARFGFNTTDSSMRINF